MNPKRPYTVFATILIVLMTGACQSITVIDPDLQPEAQKSDSSTYFYTSIFGGIYDLHLPSGTIARCPRGVARTTMKLSFINVVLNFGMSMVTASIISTFGVYFVTFRTNEIYCAKKRKTLGEI